MQNYALAEKARRIPLTLIELPTRFVIICLNLPGSPINISGTLSETNTASFTSQIHVGVGRFAKGERDHEFHHPLRMKGTESWKMKRRN